MWQKKSQQEESIAPRKTTFFKGCRSSLMHLFYSTTSRSCSRIFGDPNSFNLVSLLQLQPLPTSIKGPVISYLVV